jgi:large subunit ribosomal protein L22
MTDKTNSAIVRARSLPISSKMSVEICNAIKGKSLNMAQHILRDAIAMKRAIPIRRYTWNRGHKTGVGPGRYLVKASEFILKLCKSVEANAENKGLDINNLLVVHAKADKGAARWHSTRKGRTKMKNTHVELMVEERKAENKGEKK